MQTNERMGRGNTWLPISNTHSILYFYTMDKLARFVPRRQLPPTICFLSGVYSTTMLMSDGLAALNWP